YVMDETHTILACGAGAVTKLKDYQSDKLERIFNFKYPYEYNTRFDELLSRKDRIIGFYNEFFMS
ncbi:MAG: coproporphyrinogen dehydrogenase HemZ, partial [Ruminococcus sp.]|nr:coproporphyrinogen dehydrogenase HemZ [Ruminococcus sp.]